MENNQNNNEQPQRKIPYEEIEAYKKDPSLNEPLSFSEQIYYEAIRGEVVRCNRYFTGKLPLNSPTKYHLSLVDKLYNSLDPEVLFGESLKID